MYVNKAAVTLQNSLAKTHRLASALQDCPFINAYDFFRPILEKLCWLYAVQSLRLCLEVRKTYSLTAIQLDGNVNVSEMQRGCNKGRTEASASLNSSGIP